MTRLTVVSGEVLEPARCIREASLHQHQLTGGPVMEHSPELAETVRLVLVLVE